MLRRLDGETSTSTCGRVQEASHASGEVTVDELLDVTGEEEVGDIREVALRERGLTDIPKALQTASELEVRNIVPPPSHHSSQRPPPRFHLLLQLSSGGVGWTVLVLWSVTTKPWATTQVLSLSHNQLTSAQSLCWFVHLKYLNLNFNSLTSIAGIQYCRELRHL